jgi:hypothetical protein
LTIGQRAHDHPSAAGRGRFSLKGQCHEIFASGFFHESVSPHAAPEYPIRAVTNFLKIRRDSASQGAPLVSTKLVANLPLVSTTLAATLPPVTLVLWRPVANLPLASTIPAANDTGGK